jgi:protein-glutamine gamma-glutamyltransferase
MRFGLIHRILTDAIAALGLLSLVTSGELQTWVSVVIISALTLAMLVPERAQGSAPLRNFGVVGSLVLLAVQTARVFLGHEVLTVAVEFAAGLQLIRLATRRGAAHDQQIVLLALLHLVAGTVLGGGLAYGLCFLGFLVVAPGALVLSHLRREVEGNYRQGARDRTGLPVDVPRILRSRRVISGRFLLATCSLAVPIFVFTALLFVLFPRVGLSLLLVNHSRSERMVGFSDRVDLGKVGRLRSDPTIAARVHLPRMPEEPPLRIALYLRGAAFDAYDGRSWSRDKTQLPAETTGNRVWTDPTGSSLGSELMLIDLEPIKPPVVFLPGSSAAFDILTLDDRLTKQLPRVTVGREADFQYQSSEEQGLRYRVFSATQRVALNLSADDQRRYLTLPPELSERTHALAREWAKGANSPREVAESVERHLRAEYHYDLESPSGAAVNPLEDFLFQSRRGHCEYYSTSMAVLLRTLGIPSRNVTGFAGGTFNRFGRFYAVRQGDAHSWVEAFLPGLGWQRFDPTPASDAVPRAETSGLSATLRDLMEAASERWDRHIVGYDLEQQVAFLQSVRQKLQRRSDGPGSVQTYAREVLIGLLVLAMIATLVWYRRKLRRAPPLPPRPILDNAAARRAVSLYLELESVMLSWGVPRNPGTPPLGHARGLAALRHPIAGSVMELTDIYQQVRFGQRGLTEPEAAAFRDRLQQLRRERSA